jgi:hypothetical protein
MRTLMTRAGITPQFPVSRKDFEKAYIKYLEERRRE